MSSINAILLAYGPAASGGSSTWNPADKNPGVSLSSGNTVATGNSSVSVRGTQGRSGGVRQFELTLTGNTAGSDSVYLGIGGLASTLNAAPGTESPSTNAVALRLNGDKWRNLVNTAYTTAFSIGVVITVVADFTLEQLTFYKNGVSLGVAYSGANFPRAMGGGAIVDLYPFVGGGGSGGGWSILLRTVSMSFPVAGATDWG